MTEVVPMNDTSARPIRKFNPGMFQSDDEVVKQFVVRQRELDLVLEVIRNNIDSPSCQHLLIVAPRGRGKTMLLARVGAELRTNKSLSERLFPVRFMEESQEIVTLADFWLEALFHLAHANATGNPELSQELLVTHADLTDRWRDTNIEGYARAAVLAAADRMGQKLVLMVENLQTLCGDVDKDFGWKLRQTLQSEPHIMLLATATSRFKGLDDATQPFFELFRIVDLEPLNTVACRQLWNMVSGDAQTSREIKPLQILTGGSPRLIIIVATFARHRSLRRLLEDLVTLVDDHTEYFRSHLEGLAKIERRVYLAVIDLWQPSSAHEIAARARTDIRTVSALIARLVNRGAVLVEGTGRKRRYSAAERLYSIYYKLRRERDEAELVRNLIQFMTVFYHSDELAEMTGTWRMEAAQSAAIREGLERALAASDTLDLQMEVAKALLNKGVMHHERGEYEAELAAYDDLVTHFADSVNPDLQVRAATAILNKGVTHGQRDETAAELAAYDDLVTRFGDSNTPELQVHVAIALLFKGFVYGQRDESEVELAAYDDLVARFGDSDTPELQVHIAMALQNKSVTHGQRDESEAALAACDDLVARFGTSDLPELQVQVAKALLNKGVAHGRRDETAAELATYDDLIARFGNSKIPELQVQIAKVLLNRGFTHGGRDESEAALAAYDDLIARFGDSNSQEFQVQVAFALLNKGVTHGQRDESEAALATCDDLVKRFDDSNTPEIQIQVAKALFFKGFTHGQRDESEAALVAYDNLIRRYGDSNTLEIQIQVAKALFFKGAMHGQRGESEAALATCDDLDGRYGDCEIPEIQIQIAMALILKGFIHVEREEFKVGLAACDDLVARFGASDSPEIQLYVAVALVFKGDQQIEIGRAHEALLTSDEFDERFGAITDNELGAVAFWRWQAKWMRAHALLVLKEQPAALNVFQSLCNMFVSDNETMLREMVVRVPILIAAGASERDLEKILSANSKTADALAPLIVALRQLAGKLVRASTEVLEVAADVQKYIETTKRLKAGREARKGGD